MMNAHSPSAGRTILSLLAVLLLITAFVLLALNAYMQQPVGSARTNAPLFGGNSEQAYKDGYQAARNRFAQLYPGINTESRVVSGTIVSVSANGFILTQDSLAVDPKADGIADNRTISVDEKTSIVTVKEKDPDDFRKEMQEFLEKSGSRTTPPPAPPLATTETTTTLSNLRVGQRVTVESDADLRFLPTIHAVTVRAMP